MEGPEQNLPGPDGQQIKTGDNSPVQLTRFQQPQKSARDLIIGTALALSMACNIAAVFKMRDVGTLKWLHDWDLNQFENGPFADLKIKVETDDALIKAFGPQQCKRTP